MQQIIRTYEMPDMDMHALMEKEPRDLDVLRAFSEACRRDMNV